MKTKYLPLVLILCSLIQVSTARAADDKALQAPAAVTLASGLSALVSSYLETQTLRNGGVIPLPEGVAQLPRGLMKPSALVKADRLKIVRNGSRAGFAGGMLWFGGAVIARSNNQVSDRSEKDLNPVAATRSDALAAPQASSTAANLQ